METGGRLRANKGKLRISTVAIKNKNYSKLDRKLSRRGFFTTKIIVNGSKLTKIKSKNNTIITTLVIMN